MKNPFSKRSRVYATKIREVVRCFCAVMSRELAKS